MSKYTPALTLPVAWNVKDNTFDDRDKFPKALSLFVPVESAHELASYLINMADNQEKLREGKIYDSAKKENRRVKGFYINSKGLTSEHGDFGSVNPAACPSPCSTGNCPVPTPATSDLPY